MGQPFALSDLPSIYDAALNGLIHRMSTPTSTSSVSHPSDYSVARGSIDWTLAVPYFALHVGCISVLWVGWSWTSIAVALGLLVLRIFALTGFYHRYFSHRSFKTSRWFQFVLAFIGTTSIQRGPIWWAAHHREHHRHSDDEADVHSPHVHGFLWSHMLWFLTRDSLNINRKKVSDLDKYPELRFLDNFHLLPPALLFVAFYVSGAWLHTHYPTLGVTGWQLVVWQLLSTIALYHVTYSINSLSHMIGHRRFETSDDSRNNWLLALVTFGEGWHNNHHRYPASARQGFYWWEIDVTYYALVAMSWVGLVWDLKAVPAHILHEGEVAMETRSERS